MSLPASLKHHLTTPYTSIERVTCNDFSGKSTFEDAVSDDKIQASLLGREKQRLEDEVSKLKVLVTRVDIDLIQIHERKEKEQPRKEAERRKRQEELQQQEEQRQEEQRRQEKLAKEEAARKNEELRGPRIWARCDDTDHLVDNFDRTVMQVALGPRGYVALLECTSFWSCSQ
ncbi:unnamed protein product [Polarella glacialis]|uniref:Uncharacterized protein n=1 Tax=Polarella glacialis TaxID=89957 RepID=A0A813M234_POLGL|nr:unnamed protein product [Polarella glacialis]CAE8741524.1 unnamed protein product [Polarella glacialis]